MDDRNATGSWSGYLHQGKVGLLIGLRKINELIEANKDLLDWVIEYESAEDIDIKYGEKVVSRHQVKAYKNAKYPNDYVDVLGILDYEMKDGKRVRTTKGFQIHGFDENGNALPLEVDEDSRYLHTITETLGFDLPKEEFEKLHKRAKYIENPNNIKLYVYPDNNGYCEISCSSNKLMGFCEAEIKKILSSIDHIFKDAEGQHKNIFFALVNALDIEIRRNHIIGEGSYPVLKFSDIYRIITNTEEYKRSNIEFIRERFAESWNIFVDELNESGIPYNCSQEEKILKTVDELYRLDDDHFVQFLKDINPNENTIGNIDTIKNVTDICKLDNLKDIFYYCLLYVTESEFIVNYIGYKEDGGYLLTLINRKPMIVKSVISNIISNSGISNEIFDRSYLINGQIDEIRFGSIIENTVTNSDMENSWKGLATEKDQFINPDMEFITLERATEKLNKGRRGC